MPLHLYVRSALSMYLLSLSALLGLMSISLTCSAHGGTPRVLSLHPPLTAESPFWIVDTLGLFRGDSTEQMSLMNPRSSQAWSWLCDDAVDPTLGVDALIVLDPETLVAVARSGVYRSQDGGCTFTRVQSAVNEHAIGDLSAHPTQRNEVALFTDSVGQENHVWWSADGGLSWSRSDLIIEGVISAMWRDPSQPDELWVSHAEGLARSRDGGRTFERLTNRDYSVGATPREVTLLGGGQLGGRLHLWASLNRFPTASLLISRNEGETWREIHRLDDSYDQLAITADALWVSAPFEGLFVYPLSSAEREGTPEAWGGFWRQYSETFVSCLTPDPRDPSAMWACGRSAPTDWIVASSRDLGESWAVSMGSYQDAAEGSWGCEATSSSAIACSTRCLAEGCDPSMNMPPPSGGESVAGGLPIDGEASGEGGEMRERAPHSSGGCQMRARGSRASHGHHGLGWLLSGLLWLGVIGRRHNSHRGSTR